MRTIGHKMLLVAMTAMALAACGDKDSGNPDTVSGGTRPPEEPDTISGSTRPADGAVVKGTIGYGTFTLDGVTQQGAYGIDFNKDGILEYSITDDGMSLTYNASANNIVVSSNCIAPLSKHSSINATCNYAGSGHTPLAALSALPEKFYVGCRIRLTDGMHYGWIKVKYDDGELEWDKCAYNTTPNGPVTAGDD